MVTVNNREVLRRIEVDAYLQPGMEKVPNELNDKIQPILICNPKKAGDIVRHAEEQDAETSSTDIYSVPKGYTFYITSAFLSIVTTAAATATHASLIVIDSTGDGQRLLSFQLDPTGVAERKDMTISFTEPIKVEYNQAVSAPIAMSADGGGALNALRMAGGVTGYLESSQ